MVVVTDAVPAMGLPPGRHHLGAQIVDVKDGRAMVAGTETLAGRSDPLQQAPDILGASDILLGAPDTLLWAPGTLGLLIPSSGPLTP